MLSCHKNKEKKIRQRIKRRKRSGGHHVTLRQARNELPYVENVKSFPYAIRDFFKNPLPPTARSESRFFFNANKNTKDTTKIQFYDVRLLDFEKRKCSQKEKKKMKTKEEMFQ